MVDLPESPSVTAVGVICAAALAGSYLLSPRLPSVVLGVVGLAGVLGGIVILLRRRDYRQLRASYGDPGQLTEESED